MAAPIAKMLSILPISGFIFRSSGLPRVPRRSTGDEAEEPGGERECQDEAEVHQRERSEMGFETKACQREARGDREEHANEQTDHPSREGGAGNLNDRGAARNRDGR